MDYIFYQAAAVNGFDSFGHYLRAGLIVNQCSTYAVDPTRRLLGELPPRGGVRDRRGAASTPRDPVLAWTARVLRGRDPRSRDRARRRAGAREPAAGSAAPRRPRRRRRPRTARAAPAARRRPSDAGAAAAAGRRRPAADADAAARATPSVRCSTTCSGGDG